MLDISLKNNGIKVFKIWGQGKDGLTSYSSIQSQSHGILCFFAVKGDENDLRTAKISATKVFLYVDW